MSRDYRTKCHIQKLFSKHIINQIKSTGTIQLTQSALLVGFFRSREIRIGFLIIQHTSMSLDRLAIRSKSHPPLEIDALETVGEHKLKGVFIESNIRY